MPIPTRTLSQRQARQSIISTPRTNTNNNTSALPKHAAGGDTGSRPNSSAANNNNVSERPLSRSGIPQLALRDSTVTTTAMQKKSLLPQRSLQTSGGDGSGAATKASASSISGSRIGGVNKSTPGTTIQNLSRDVVPPVQGQLETTDVEDVTSKDTPTFSQRAETSPTVAYTPSTTPAPPSPRKKSQPPPLSSTTRPGPLKKNDMPPPPRPNRSASLRQPVAPSPTATSSSAGSARTHIRHRSQIIPPSTTTQLKKQQGDFGYGTSSVVSGHRAKPSFSTFQQQFSPRKPAIPSSAGPKSASISTSVLGSGSTPAAAASTDSDSSSSLLSSSWPEIASLQTELLQLSLLHSSSLDKDTAWKVAAERQLRAKYDAVAGTHRDVLQKEQEYQRWINARALDTWMQFSFASDSHGRGKHGGHPRLPFAEQVQIFSRVLQEVSDLTEPEIVGDGKGGGGGRYNLVLGAFEAWLQHAQQVQRHRDHLQRLSETSDGDHHLSTAPSAGVELTFIEPLDQVWKEELGSLLAKVELCARQLQGLDVLTVCEEEQTLSSSVSLSESSLVRIATGLSETLDMMIEEIHVMREIEREIVRGEREWARRLTERVVAGRRSAPAVCRESEMDVNMSLRGLWRDTLT